MVIAMVARGASPPEAVLTEVIVVAPLTLVPEPHERLPVTAFTLDRVEHCNRRPENTAVNTPHATCHTPHQDLRGTNTTAL